MRRSTDYRDPRGRTISSHSAPLPLRSIAATCQTENFRSGNENDAERNRYSTLLFALSILIHATPPSSLSDDRGDLSLPHRLHGRI